MYAEKSAFCPANNPNYNDHTSATVEFSGADNSALLVGFSVPEAYRYKIIDKMILHLYADSWDTSPMANALKAEFDEKTVTRNTAPEAWTNAITCINKDGIYYTRQRCWRYSNAVAANKWNVEGLRNGFAVKRGTQGWIDTARSGNKPHIVITYIDRNALGTVGGLSPASGYVAKKKSNTFTWRVESDALCVGEIAQASASFRWRVGSAGTEAAIPVYGSTTSITVPAGTFTEDEIQWSVAVTLNTGEIITSDWCALSTREAMSTATAITPVGIVIDGTVANRFAWRHEIATGTEQTRADLQQSTDGSQWTELATALGEKTSCDIPENTFGAGTRYWRVRTYNTDNAPGEWSEAAEFVAINAPGMPVVTVQEGGPRPRISWMAEGQEAYQIALSDGYESGTSYGTEREWRSPHYLSDGTYTIKVRVQNRYGMWSKWGEATVPVKNTQGTKIELTVSTSYEGALSWSTDGDYDFYAVMRDGVTIAREEGKGYTDRTGIGNVAYQVRGCYEASGNYGLSNTEYATIMPETVALCDMETGAWMELPTSEAQLRSSVTQRRATVSTTHLTGMEYPIAERAEFRDLTISASCAFRSGDARGKMLENLIGRLICIKTPQGDAATGVLAILKKTGDRLITRYSLEVSQISTEEKIEL